jgi:hypothetical protein
MSAVVNQNLFRMTPYFEVHAECAQKKVLAATQYARNIFSPDSAQLKKC